MRKLFPVVITLVLFILAGCRKSMQMPVSDADTAFDLSGTDVYINSEMSVTVKNVLSTTYD